MADHNHGQVVIARAEFKELRDIVKELAEAQKRTDKSLAELVDVQKKFATTFEIKMGALGAR
ncbi:MAG: hypothetical protein H0M93_04650 [Methanophagales archaeon]|nr:hypothetical protein [Methanophagales archaeon]